MLVATVSGYVGTSELRTTNDGRDVLNFSVAHSEKVKGVDTTTWVRVSVFGNRATSLSNWIVKGVHVTCIGALKISQYEKDGKSFLNVDMSAMDVSFTSSKSKDEPSQGKPAPEQPAPNDEDVPF
jgi:single-strand DNA-binding protein